MSSIYHYPGHQPLVTSPMLPVLAIIDNTALDSSFSDYVSSIIIGNQAINLYGGPEASAEHESSYCMILIKIKSLEKART